jgi:cysteine synthase A
MTELKPGHTIIKLLAVSSTRYRYKLFNPEFLKSHDLLTPPWLE